MKIKFAIGLWLLGGLILVAITGCQTSGSRVATPKISVFMNSVRAVEKQQGISFAEACARLYALGVRGIDANYKDSDLEAVASSTLKLINLYGFPRFFAEDNGRSDCEEYVATAVKYKVPRIMCIPQDFTDGISNERELQLNISGLKNLVAIAKAKGIKVMVEPFGGRQNPCSYAANIKRFMTEIPELYFAWDAGNLYYANRGDSADELWAFAGARVEHIHLKDLSGVDHHSYQTLGLGDAGIGEVAKTVAKTGYDGWWTLENLVGDIVDDIARQSAVLKRWIVESH